MIENDRVDYKMKKFKTILADPPWDIEFIKLKMRPNQIDMPYPTMLTKEIKAIPVGDIADKDCNLFLWVTHTSLPDGLEVAKAWGFKYHALLTWDKTNGRPCMGFKRDTEFVIYAYKHRITIKQKGEFIHTLFTEAATEHSRKPGLLYTILENNTPDPRIELFARRRRKNWWCVGNEINGMDIRECLTKGIFESPIDDKWRIS